MAEDKDKISLKDAISIGIGGMVGGGIFAVLGLSVTLAKGGVPISFLVAGIIALMTAYAYAKLSLAYPDEGGTVRFIYEGFGYSIFSGGLNNMLWVSYIIMLSLYSSAFGSYASSLIPLTDNVEINKHIFITFILLFSTAINYYSIKVVGEVEAFAVIVKLLILLAFVAAGFWGITENPNFHQLSPTNWETPLQLIAGGMVIFVAYEGFELIANSAPDITKPQVNIPKAYYISVIFVILLYIAIAIVTVGSLDFPSIGKASDYALAEAAKPKFGQLGFTIISVAAMISTFSAINATLLGGSRTNYEVAVYNELPAEFSRTLWGKPFGLFVISLLSIIIANSIDLESISTSGSAGFLIIFGMVNYIAYKKSKDVKANKIITLSGFICCLLAFFILSFQQIQNNFAGMLTAFIIFSLCFLLEWMFQKHLKKKINNTSK